MHNYVKENMLKINEKTGNFSKKINHEKNQTNS